MKNPSAAPRAGMLLLLALFLPATAQEEAPGAWVELPALRGYKLPDQSYLILGTRVGQAQADFIRGLRSIPAVPSDSVPTGLFIGKYLHRKSEAVDTGFGYFESDWLGMRELLRLAAVTKHAALQSEDLFDRPSRSKVRMIFLRRREDYHSMIDAWADTDAQKRAARRLGSLFMGDIRCGYESRTLGALSLTLADTFTEHLSLAFNNQEALQEGFHAYLTGLIALEYTSYVSSRATTPSSREGSSLRTLFQTAREVLSRSRRESLETILRCELNVLTQDRLSVSVALIQYLLEQPRHAWKIFCRTLDRESMEKGKIRGPEGRLAALKAAVREGFSLSLEELERELQIFVRKQYLYPEEEAALLGVTPALADGFVKVCELKRLKQAVSGKGEKLYEEVLKRMEKVLEERGERF